jgi:hypothetical protein
VVAYLCIAGFPKRFGKIGFFSGFCWENWETEKKGLKGQ